jgi:hypothetical protein
MIFHFMKYHFISFYANVLLENPRVSIWYFLVIPKLSTLVPKSSYISKKGQGGCWEFWYFMSVTSVWPRYSQTSNIGP